MAKSIDIVHILISQGRFEQAEKKLREILSTDVHHAEAHGLLGLTLMSGNKTRQEEAKRELETALSIRPDEPYFMYLLANWHLKQDNYKAAEEHIRQSVRLNPFDADYFYTLAVIQIGKDEWEEALETLDYALAIDAEHVNSLNLRARCLVRLGRKEEAFTHFEASFSKDPNNSDTHANQGWAKLEAGNYNEALEHFKEALKIQPTNNYAKTGLVEALKAQHLIYGWFLKWNYWLVTMSEKAKWGLFIGLIVVVNVFRPLLPLYLLLIVFTWFSDVIFNSLLRLNSYGKYALSKNQVVASNYFLLLITGAIGFGIAMLLSPQYLYLLLAAACLGLLFPVVTTFSIEHDQSRKKSGWYALVMLAVAIGMISLEIVEPNGGMGLLNIFVFGIAAYTWFVQFLPR